MQNQTQPNNEAGAVVHERLVSGSSERLAMEILSNDMRITDARLSDAIDHEKGLRALHDAAKDRVELLRSIKRDLQSRVNSICSANADVDLPDTAAQDSASKSSNPAVSG